MLDEKKKAALEAYLSKKGNKPGEKGGEKPVVKEETEIEVEDEGGDVPDDFSYRMSEDRDPEDEYYGAMGRDPSEMDTTDRAPRGEGPRSGCRTLCKPRRVRLLCCRRHRAPKQHGRL